MSVLGSVGTPIAFWSVILWGGKEHTGNFDPVQFTRLLTTLQNNLYHDRLSKRWWL